MREDLVQNGTTSLTAMFDREEVELAIGVCLNDTCQSSGIHMHEFWPLHSCAEASRW